MKAGNFFTILGLTTLLCIILGGCTAEQAETQVSNTEQQVRELFQSYYDNQINGNYEDAFSLMLFSDSTADERSLFPESFLSTPVQSYTILSVNELTTELYEVYIIGTYLTPVKIVYGDDGVAIGIESNKTERWFVDTFNKASYAVCVDGKWNVCNSARNVPDGLYEFSEKELEAPGALTSVK